MFNKYDKEERTERKIDLANTSWPGGHGKETAQMSRDSDSDGRDGPLVKRCGTSSVRTLRERPFPNENAQANREERLRGVSGTHKVIHFQCELCCGRLLEGLVIRPDDHLLSNNV